jgi:transposase
VGWPLSSARRKRRKATLDPDAARRAVAQTTLVQAAWVAARTRDTYLRAQFLRLKSRRGPKKAILAVAASMLTAAYYILKNETVYADLGGDYFERRSKAQITRRLVKRLESLGLSVEIRPAA